MFTNAMMHTAATDGTQSSKQTSSSTSGKGLDTMFMQLLITQLQNQDPLSPMDASTFVNQLVGVNTLDQVSQINKLLQANAQ